MPKHRYLRVEILISSVRARHKFFRLKSIVFMVCKYEYMDICNRQFSHMSAIDPSDRLYALSSKQVKGLRREGVVKFNKSLSINIISVFNKTDHKKIRFQKKLIMQNTNI